MSVRYRSIFPVSQKSSYGQNDNVDLVLNLEGEKLIPGTVTLEGKCAVYSTGTTAVVATDAIYYEPRVGYHGMIRDLTTEFQNVGILESLQNYPRLVKMHALANTYDESFGTETMNGVEGRVPNKQIAKGYLEGQRANDSFIPFSLKLNCVVNKASGPLASAAVGQVRLRLRLSPNEEFLFGEDFDVANSSYAIQDLKLRYQTMADDGVRAPVNLELYHSFRSILDSNNQNIATFVPGLCDSVHMSFINQTQEQTSTQNYILCSPPPGKPPLGFEGTDTPQSYGIERLYYAINDTDTALVGFTMESREEIVRNGLRSFDPSVDKYSALIRHMRDPDYPDGYLAGIPLGGLLDFTKNKFAVEIQSQCDNNDVYVAYLYFRMQSTINA
jgi:hypothetical protein